MIKFKSIISLVLMITLLGIHSNPLFINEVSAVSLEEISYPKNITVELNGIDDIEITWDAVNGAAGYNIYKGSEKYGNYRKLNTEMIQGNKYVVETSNIYGYVGYDYGVSSIKAGKESEIQFISSDHLIPQEKVVKEMVIDEAGSKKTIAKIEPFHFYIEFENTPEDRFYLPISNNSKKTVVSMEGNHFIDFLDEADPNKLVRKIHIKTKMEPWHIL